jgi:hypothetical protein
MPAAVSLVSVSATAGDDLFPLQPARLCASRSNIAGTSMDIHSVFKIHWCMWYDVWYTGPFQVRFGSISLNGGVVPILSVIYDDRCMVSSLSSLLLLTCFFFDPLQRMASHHLHDTAWFLGLCMSHMTLAKSQLISICFDCCHILITAHVFECWAHELCLPLEKWQRAWNCWWCKCPLMPQKVWDKSLDHKWSQVSSTFSQPARRCACIHLRPAVTRCGDVQGTW